MVVRKPTYKNAGWTSIVGPQSHQFFQVIYNSTDFGVKVHPVVD